MACMLKDFLIQGGRPPVGDPGRSSRYVLLFSFAIQLKS